MTAGITTIAALVAWWKNNSFTKEAIAADKEYDIAAIRHILHIHLSPFHFRSIFLYVNTRLPAFLQKSFFLITNGEMLRLKK